MTCFQKPEHTPTSDVCPGQLGLAGLTGASEIPLQVDLYLLLCYNTLNLNYIRAQNPVKIDENNKDGKGAIFTFTVPLAKA